MHEHKIRNFERDNPGALFPVFRPIGQQEASVLRSRLAQAFGLRDHTDPVSMLKELLEAAELCAGLKGTDQDFNFKQLLESRDIHPRDSIYLNWHHYDHMDEMGTLDFSEHIEDIWYPSADDLDVFDSTFTWIAWIEHDGTVSVTKQIQK